MTHYTLRRRISLRESFLEVLRRRSVVIRPVNILYIIFNVIIAYSVNSLKVKKKINKYYKYDIFYEFYLFIFLLLLKIIIIYIYGIGIQLEFTKIFLF